jgi:branched-chain amino acid transport system substrate-binding protein
MKTTMVMVLGLAGLCTAPAMAQVKIGFLGTLSGQAADVGRDQADGFMLAVEQGKGKLGGYDVKVIQEDDQMKPDVGMLGLTKLLEREKVDIVTGLTYANVMMALQAKIGASKIPFVGSVSGPSPLAGAQCKPNLFVTSWQSDATAEAMGKYLNDQKVADISIIAPNFLGSKDKVTGLKRFYKGKISNEIYTSLTQLDFSAELSQIGAAKPAGVFGFFPGGQGVSFVRQYQQMGMAKTIPLYSVHTLEPTSLGAIGKVAYGNIVAEAWQPSADNAQNKQFVAAYEKKYGRTPTSFAAFSYDAAILIGEALKKVGGKASDSQAFIDAIRTTPFPSVRGDFKFNKNNYPIQNYNIYQVAEGADGKPAFKMLVKNVLASHGDAYAEQCGAAK